ncbi:MAG: hypothetical protein AAAFM81_14730 [Pseudomonadota bacterium]
MTTIRVIAGMVIALFLNGCALDAARDDEVDGLNCTAVQTGAPFFEADDRWPIDRALFAAHLRELEEPVVRDAEVETVRMTILVHDDPPLSIRVARTDDALSTLTGKFYDGAGGWCPENFPASSRRYETTVVTEKIDDSFWSDIRASVEQSLQTVEENPVGINEATQELRVCVHATSWLVEYTGPNGFEYAIHNACTLPPPNEPVDTLCHSLTALMPVLPKTRKRYCRDVR